MSVARAILAKGISIESIADALCLQYGEVVVHPSSIDFFYVIFNDGKDKRNLAVSFSNGCERDNGISGVWCSLGCWGNSVEIMRYLCETFGGYLDENDCDNEGFYPINFHLYSKGKEFTKLDELRHKVISELGYDNLDKAMKLFEEYAIKIFQK